VNRDVKGVAIFYLHGRKKFEEKGSVGLLAPAVTIVLSRARRVEI